MYAVYGVSGLLNGMFCFCGVIFFGTGCHSVTRKMELYGREYMAFRTLSDADFCGQSVILLMRNLLEHSTSTNQAFLY